MFNDSLTKLMKIKHQSRHFSGTSPCAPFRFAFQSEFSEQLIEMKYLFSDQIRFSLCPQDFCEGPSVGDPAGGH